MNASRWVRPVDPFRLVCGAAALALCFFIGCGNLGGGCIGTGGSNGNDNMANANGSVNANDNGADNQNDNAPVNGNENENDNGTGGNQNDNGTPGNDNSPGNVNQNDNGTGNENDNTNMNDNGSSCTTAADCDDTNVCTDDACVGGACQHAFNTATCNDGLFCTATDACNNGVCTGTGSPCTGGQVCSEANDECTGCQNSAECNDGNPCTVDSCSAGVCSNSAAAGGACGSSADTDCTNPDTCDASGACVANHAANGTACDDGDSCTAGESCTNGVCGGGTPAADGTACDDGLFCTADSSCLSGVCTGGGTSPCEAPESQCDEDADLCRPQAKSSGAAQPPDPGGDPVTVTLSIEEMLSAQCLDAAVWQQSAGDAVQVTLADGPNPGEIQFNVPDRTNFSATVSLSFTASFPEAECGTLADALVSVPIQVANVTFDLPEQVVVGTPVDLDNISVLDIQGAPESPLILFFLQDPLPPGVSATIDENNVLLVTAGVGQDLEIFVSVIGTAGILAEESDIVSIVSP